TEVEATSILPSWNGKTARSRGGIVPFTHLVREGRITVTIGRRELLAALGGAAVVWPLAARAQQAGMGPRIGYLGNSTPTLERQVLDAFRQKLRELGHVEGENIAIEYRWAEGHDDRLADLAAELVRLKPDVIMTTGSPGTFAAKRATDTIPIIFMGS